MLRMLAIMIESKRSFGGFIRPGVSRRPHPRRSAHPADLSAMENGMYVVNDLPPKIDRGLLDQLIQSDPATIGHFLHIGFMDPAIRGLMQNTRIAGTAIPIRAPGPDSTIIHYALGQVREGDVLVIDRCGDHKHAGTGGVVAYAARKAGVAGIIVDGVVADLHELREYGVPIWARGSSGVTTKRAMGCGGQFCAPASCGGVVV
jgi:4-hydroxy-4-methyl-2-oxoglutarate aldolase